MSSHLTKKWHIWFVFGLRPYVHRLDVEGRVEFTPHLWVVEAAWEIPLNIRGPDIEKLLSTQMPKSRLEGGGNLPKHGRTYPDLETKTPGKLMVGRWWYFQLSLRIRLCVLRKGLHRSIPVLGMGLKPSILF